MSRSALATLVDADEPTASISAHLGTSLRDEDATVTIPRAQILELVEKLMPATPATPATPPRATQRDWEKLSAALLESDAHSEDVDFGDAALPDDSVWVEFE